MADKWIGIGILQNTGIWVLVCLGLYFSSLYSYLLFHSIAEIFSIAIACSVFSVAWNSRRFAKNDYLLFLGIAFLFVAILDLLHCLAYKGLQIFPGYGANLATQLWVAARYVQSLSLLLSPLFFHYRLRPLAGFGSYLLICTLLMLSIFYWNIFPICYVEERGLTAFKDISEYIICFILLAAIGLLWRHRQRFDQTVLRLLIWSMILTIGSELAFTLYVGVYDFPNLVGHLLKILSFFLIYKALVEIGLAQPYSLLFRELSHSEEALRHAHDMMEQQVVERTADLRLMVDQLQEEMTERRRAEDHLRASLQEKEVLLKEIHHRVKNNMQIISTLLSLQLKYCKDQKPAQLFQDCQNRIRSMALIHESLYSTEDLANIHFRQYLEKLSSRLLASYGANAQNLKITVTGNDVKLAINQAVPCGLIANELIVNSLKHAFLEKQEGEIQVSIAENDGQRVLEVRDNGAGLGSDFDLENPTTFGWVMVKNLAKQLGGEFKATSNGGTSCKVLF